MIRYTTCAMTDFSIKDYQSNTNPNDNVLQTTTKINNEILNQLTRIFWGGKLGSSSSDIAKTAIEMYYKFPCWFCDANYWWSYFQWWAYRPIFAITVENYKIVVNRIKEAKSKNLLYFLCEIQQECLPWRISVIWIINNILKFYTSKSILKTLQ